MKADLPLAMPVPMRLLWGLAVVPALIAFAGGSASHFAPAKYPYRDLTQDWLSARCRLDGISVYTRHQASIPRYLDRKDGGREWPVALNAHPPVCVLTLLPLGLLTHDAAVLAWNLASLVMLVAAAGVILGRWGLNCEWWYPLAACCLLAASTPLAAQGAAAQLNPLLLLLIALSWACNRQDKQTASGLFLGIAVAIKLFPAFLLVYFVCSRRWKATAVAGATIALLHAASILVFGWADVAHYFQRVIPEVDVWRSAWLNCSVSGFWSRLLHVTDAGTREWLHSPLLAAGLTYATCGALGGAVAWRTWRARSVADRDLAFATAMVVMLLVSPVTWDHSLLLLLLPVSVLWFYTAHTPISQLLLMALLFVPAFVPARDLWQLLLEPGWLPVMNRVADPSRSVVALAVVTYCLAGLAALAMFGSPAAQNRPLRVMPRAPLNAAAGPR